MAFSGAALHDQAPPSADSSVDRACSDPTSACSVPRIDRRSLPQPTRPPESTCMRDCDGMEIVRLLPQPQSRGRPGNCQTDRPNNARVAVSDLPFGGDLWTGTDFSRPSATPALQLRWHLSYGGELSLERCTAPNPRTAPDTMCGEKRRASNTGLPRQRDWNELEGAVPRGTGRKDNLRSICKMTIL